MNRVKHEAQAGADVAGKKAERFKYVLEYNNTLEYIYDLEEHKIISQQEADERAPTVFYCIQENRLLILFLEKRKRLEKRDINFGKINEIFGFRR